MAKNILESNIMVGKLVAVLVALLLVVVLVYPVINTVGNGGGGESVTVTNTGVPFALANADSDEHTIVMSLSGQDFSVTSDGEVIMTDIGEVLPSTSGKSPFNVYYVAMNLVSGDNADDSGETRLSKEKGAIAYYLNPNNLKQTQAGYTFDPTLYNVMLVIPPVYWYSNGIDTLYIASTPDAFTGLTLKDYAHTYTDNRTGGTGQTGHSSAIAIGVYEAYNLNGTLVSQSDRTPTASTSYRDFINLSKVNNTDNDHSVYGLWNWFDYTLYRIMCWTVMGNTDSQYMMGWGPTATGSSTVTGLTSAGYTKSENNQSSVCLFIENSWGSLDEYLGDTSALYSDGLTWKAGNSLNQPINYNSLVNVLEGDYTIKKPSAVSGVAYQTTSLMTSDGFGLPVYNTGSATSTTSGEGINDIYGSNTKNKSPVSVGGAYFTNLYTMYGLSYVNPGTVKTADDWTSASGAVYGTRIFCHILDDDNLLPIENDYAYTMQLNNTTYTTIENISVEENGQMVSKMPTGTTLNEYWSFVSESIPAIADSTASMTLAVGSDAVLQIVNSGNAVIQTSNGTVDLGRLDTPVSVSIQNGIMTYDGGSADIYLYRAVEGDYVYSIEPSTVLTDTVIYVGQYDYGYTTDNGTKNLGVIGSGTVDTLATNIQMLNTSDVTESATTIDMIGGSGYATINGVMDEVVFNDDSVQYPLGVYVPQSVTYGGSSDSSGYNMDGVSIAVLKIIPIILMVCILLVLVMPMFQSRTN